MLLCLLPLTFLISLPWSLANPLSMLGVRRGSALHLPLSRREASTSTPQRVPKQGAIGLGNYIDVCVIKYTVAVPLYLQTSFQPSSLAIRLQYSDTLTGTFAQGSVRKDVAGIAGLQLQDQYLAAISEMNTSILQTGSAGIFGLGFPVNRWVSDLPVSVI